MKLIPTLIAMLGLAAVPAAIAQGCCGGGQAASHAGCGMAGQTACGGHEGQAGAQSAPPCPDTGERHVFMKPVQMVFDNYIKVQAMLAQDSMEGIGGTADQIAKVVREDSKKRFPPKIAQQAEALSQAKDLETARTAFKALSESLIGYVKQQEIPAGAYYVAYCPMAKASWLQRGKTVINPYMGKGMIHCGQIQS